MKELKYDVVKMEQVPDPPMGSRSCQFDSAWADIKKLGYAQKEALRVAALDKKRLTYMRSALQTIAKREGLRVLSSRNQESTVAFFWAIKPGKDT
jgi:hypothetical protein